MKVKLSLTLHIYSIFSAALILFLTYHLDVDLVFVGIQLVETIKFNTPIVMDFIQFGGLDFLEKANKVHADDEFISGSIPKLLKILIGKQNISIYLCFLY